MSSNIGDDRSNLQKKWDGCKTFMYDPTTKTVMGRTGKSWAKIMIFYLFYYGFLACLFAISITIVISTLDEYTPKYQTRLQTPGLAIQPKMPSDEEQTSDITFSISDPNSYKKYVRVLDNFLMKYDSSNQTSDSLFKDCAVNAPPQKNQEFTSDQIAKACRFNKNKLGMCATANYGYDQGNPCILVKLNRIINWFPVGYTDLAEAKGNDESNAPPLTEVLEATGNSYKPYLMYTACYGAKPIDRTNLDNGNMKNNKYYPQDNGFPFAYYPYFGKKRQPNYLNPLVAVQFTNVTRGETITVHCKVYAKNIRDNKDMQEGYFAFSLRVNE